MNTTQATRTTGPIQPPTVTAPAAGELIAYAQANLGFKVEVEADNWLILKRRDFGPKLSVDMLAPTWIDDLRALLDAALLIDLSRDGALAHRNCQAPRVRH